jgi:hypothetical protein
MYTCHVIRIPSSLDIAITYFVFHIAVIVYNNIPNTAAQNGNANFLMYTNPDLGFTIKYPSNWTVNDSNNNNLVNGDKVISFASPDRCQRRMNLFQWMSTCL